MKISPKNIHARKKAFAITLVSLLALGCIVYILLLTNIFGWRSAPKTSTNVDLHPPTSEQKKAGSQVKQESLDATNSKVNNQNDTPPTPTPHTDSKSTVGVSITASSQSGATYQIRSQIDTPTDTGTCTLTLTKGSATVTKTAGIQALAKVSTCKGFDIPTSELSVGVWQMTLHFENNTLTGSTSGTITVQ